MRFLLGLNILTLNCLIFSLIYKVQSSDLCFLVPFLCDLINDFKLIISNEHPSIISSKKVASFSFLQ